MKRLRSLRILPLAALVGLGACGDSSPTGPDLSFDPTPVQDLMRAHVATFQASYGANAFLAAALQDLEPLGVTFEPMDPAPVVSPQVVFPPELMGATFVYDPAEEAWVVDDTATGAPPEGIRVTWYAMDGARFPITSQVLGHIDLTDQDADGLSRLGVKVVATVSGAPVTLTEYTVGSVKTGDVEWTERFEAVGWVDDGTRRLDFDIRGEGSGNEDTGDTTFSYDMLVEGPEGSYELELDRVVDGATETTDETWLVTVQESTGTTELLLGFSGSTNAPDIAGTLRHAGQIVARIAAASGGTLEYTTADGERYSGTERQQLESLIATMVSTAGYYLLNAVPLLYL